MKAIAERDHSTWETIYHIPIGKPDAAGTFQPIECGGGILFPGSIEDVPAVQVCPDCRAHRKTQTLNA